MLLALPELAFAAVAWPLSRLPFARPYADRGLAWFLARERARLGYAAPGGRGRGGYAFLAVRAAFATAAGYVSAATGFVGALLFFGGAWSLIGGRTDAVPISLTGVRVVTSSGILGVAGGLVLFALAALGVLAAGAGERFLAARLLGPGASELMRRRIAELTATRTGIVRAVDDERRRIERDLHDGVQQRGIALAMLLGRARHARNGAPELVEQAYAESRRLLDELRSVAWRVYPTALDELGLASALAGVAERSGVPVTVHCGLEGRLAPEVETALYFVAREAITNAVKHSGARDIVVVVAATEDADGVYVAVSDDGRGGADPRGGGLSGLARRVHALDGTLAVDSPPGGPTRIIATIPKDVPCA